MEERTHTMDINNITNHTPVEIDTELLKQHSALFKHEMRHSMWLNSLEGMAARRNGWKHTRTDVYVDANDVRVTYEMMANAIDAVVATGDSYAVNYANELARETAAIVACKRIINAIHDEWIRRGCWSRFWLVVSSSGHIHSNTECHTCNKGKNPTSFALFPTLSGFSSDEAVAELGAALCSYCFPNAPVEQREQTKISKLAAATLLETGDVDAFRAVIEKQAKNAATKCPGSNTEGIRSANGNRTLKCTQCDYVGWINWNSHSTKVQRHKPHKQKA